MGIRKDRKQTQEVKTTNQTSGCSVAVVPAWRGCNGQCNKQTKKKLKLTERKKRPNNRLATHLARLDFFYFEVYHYNNNERKKERKPNTTTESHSKQAHKLAARVALTGSTY